MIRDKTHSRLMIRDIGQSIKEREGLGSELNS